MVLKQAYAIFDLVGTLITPVKNGFKLLGEESIFEIFKELHKENFIIIILCKNVSYKLYKDVEKWFSVCDNDEPCSFSTIPLYFLYVKDNPIKSIQNLHLNIDYDVSIYCGDEVAIKDPYPPYRYSNKDSMIAQRLNLKFIRPIDLFGTYEIKPLKKQELLVMVGMPASGKSTQAAMLMKKNKRYVACDTDAMPGYSRDLTIKCVKENLLKGNSVIALALNQNVYKRSEFISIARSLGIYVRIAWFIRDGRPFNKYRHLDKTLPSTFYHKKPVPESVFKKYNDEFEEPTLKECNEIIIVY